MSTHTGSVLVVEDDVALREALCDTLRIAGFDVTSAIDGSAALGLVGEARFDAVVSDVQMQPMNGHELLAQLRTRHPDLPVVLMTAHGTIDKAVAAMRDGAADYLPKPFEAQRLIELVQRLMPQREPAGDLIAADPRTCELATLARRIAATEVTVLITGPSGTGKEVFARFIHAQSPRREAPFVAINCAAIPDNMLEAVLFGYEKGAFTGAQAAHAGKFEQAQGGTLLLDEISEMNLGLQAKLLRVLQEREVERLGSTRTITLDVRVIATSNRSLREEVAAGRFREDLFYRLNVVPLRLAPLSERRGDILPLAQTTLARLRSERGVPLTLSPQAEQRLLTHDWPGNVRELINVIQRAAILTAGPAINVQDLCFEQPEATVQATQLAAEQTPAVLNDDLRDREQALILEAIRTARSKKDAAARLGISPRTLRHKLAQMRARGVEVA